jgi:hypothetical protein
VPSPTPDQPALATTLSTAQTSEPGLESVQRPGTMHGK